MKCTSSVSASNSMSVQGCSVKLRIFVLVINTANLINVRATPSLGISHALTTPPALFTTYIFIGIFVIGAVRRHYASRFLQIYGLVSCCSVQILLSYIVFKALKSSTIIKQHAALVLDGVLPMISTVILLIDLTGVIFSNRQEAVPPSSLPSTARTSQTIEIQ